MNLKDLKSIELLKRLDDGDNQEIFEELASKISAMEKYNKTLLDENIDYYNQRNEANLLAKSMACCGNCGKRYRCDCPLPSAEENPNYKYNNKPEKYCDEYQSDNLTRKEREIK